MKCLQLLMWLDVQRRLRSGSEGHVKRGQHRLCQQVRVHGRLRTAGTFALWALLIGTAPHATAELTVIEQAIETRADAAVLPSGPLSALVVTPCTGCPPISLTSSAQSRYFLGREPVSLDVLKQRLANRPTTLLLITYRKDTRELTRIVANAQ